MAFSESERIFAYCFKSLMIFPFIVLSACGGGGGDGGGHQSSTFVSMSSLTSSSSSSVPPLSSLSSSLLSSVVSTSSVISSSNSSASASASASAIVLFNNDFETTAPQFGFLGLHESHLFPTDDPNDAWYTLDEASGEGWSGSQGAHFVTLANQRQYNAGWYLHNGQVKENGWQDGDTIYIRFRIRYDDNFRWDGEGSMQNKMVDFGLGGNGSSRVILHQEAPHPTTPCGLDNSYRPNYGAFSLKIGITFTCTPPVAITYGQWYHVQFAVRSSHGTNTDGYFKVWVNNNDMDNPSSQLLEISIPTTHDDGSGSVNYWNGSMAFGGYITDYPLRDQGWVLDDFQISDAFEADWYP